MPDRHFIYAGSRSGSNYLVNLLNQHPQVVNYNEVLGEWTIPCKIHRFFHRNQPPSADYLEYIYSSQTAFYAAQAYSFFERFRKKQPYRLKRFDQIKSLGIKDFHYHVRGDDNALWSFFLKDENMKIINLYRENLLKKNLSLQFLSTTAIVANTDNNAQISQKKATSIYLDPEETLNSLTLAKQFLDEKMTRLQQLDPGRVLHISYEQLFESQASQERYKDQLFEFLEVEKLDVKSKHRKLSSDDLPSLIENYEEIQSLLRGTEFEQYLT